MYLKKAVYIYICFIASLFALVQIQEYDINLHIKTGEWIFQNLRVPTEQLYSYMIEGKKWVDHEWLFQLFTYLIFKIAGFSGLVILCFIVMSALLFILYLIARRNKYFILSLLVIFASFQLMRARLFCRPDIVSLLFTGIFLYLIKEHYDKRRIFLLIPLQILWVNIHGYFITGPVILFLYLISKIIERNVPLPFFWNENKISYNNLKRLTWLLFLLILACLVNPNFLEGLSYPFRVMSSTLQKEDEFAFKFIAELRPTNLFDVVFGRDLCLFLLLFIFFSSLLLNIKRICIFDIIVFFICLALFLKARRHVAIFALSSGMFALFNLKEFNGIRIKILNYDIPTIKPLYCNLIATVACLLIILGCTSEANGFLRTKYIYNLKGDAKSIVFGVNELICPEACANFIKDSKAHVNIFNHFNCGAYMVRKLFPDYKVFIDGRTEVYGDDFIEEYHSYFMNPEKIDQLAKEKNVGFVVLYFAEISGISKELFNFLYHSKNWELVFLDVNSVIFARNIPQLKGMIKKNRIKLENFKIEPSQNLIKIAKKEAYYPASYINMARFFYDLDMPKNTLLAIKIAEDICPMNVMVQNAKGIALSKLGNYDEAFDAFLKAAKISPLDIDVHKNLGVTYTRLNRFREALREFETALLLDPTDEQVKMFIKEAKRLLKEPKRVKSLHKV
ncbi:MAG: tetratricopeptide repeat protein [Candidatus Omnitrophota bacterium]